MQKADLTSPPELAHDAMMVREFGECHALDQRQKNERSIVWNLCAHLKNNGFNIVAVDDGEEREELTDAKSAMELIFNLDEATLCVEKPGFAEHGILLIMGNGNEGLDLIADYNFTRSDPDGFEKAMDAFDVDALFG